MSVWVWRSMSYRFQGKNKVKFPSIQRRTVRSSWRATLSAASPQEEGQSAGGTVPQRGWRDLRFQESGTSSSHHPPACLTATLSLTTASTPSWPTTRPLAGSAREVSSTRITQESSPPQQRIVYLQRTLTVTVALVPRRTLIVEPVQLSVVIYILLT